jgi:hypothetical protein
MARTLTPTAERAKAIRKALKERGWGAKQVSVRTHNYSMGSSIRILVHDPDVSRAAVQALADEHESVRRDGFGEILSGGNRFVFVEFSHKHRDAAAARILPRVEKALAELDTVSERTHVEIEGTSLTLARDPTYPDAIALWGKSRFIQNLYGNATSIAATVWVASQEEE